MSKLGVVLVVVAGMALAGCSTKDVPAAEQGGSSASTSTSASASKAAPSAPPEAPPASVAPEAPPASVAPVTPTSTPRPSTTSALPPVPPLPAASVTAGPGRAPVTAQETAFVGQLKALSAHVADGYTAIALGHKVCNQFGAQVRYNDIADSITGYDADDARNVITAAVLTLCPQYKSQVGG